jgi:fructose-specific PTS system IIA-like component
MIEVTSAAFAMDHLSAELDFFSIGSNDLLQYFMAVDRANTRVAGLYNPLHPAFLRFLKQIVDAARARGKWVGLCGEIGSQPRLLPLLVGLGLHEISIAAPAVAEIKARLSRLDLAECRELFQRTTECATAEEVAAVLDEFTAGHSEPLITPELILTDIDAATRAEAIKQALDLLYVSGRVAEPRVVEEAVWEREKAYSTGFGHGFAIPHCKSRAVQSNSLVVLKLRQPVEWEALDGEPVRVVILLTIRECDSSTEHMKVFSRLARQVVHEEFRARLQQETDAAAICAFLSKALEV